MAQDNEFLEKYDKELKEFVTTELEQLKQIRSDLAKRDPRSFQEDYPDSSSDDDSDTDDS